MTVPAADQRHFTQDVARLGELQPVLATHAIFNNPVAAVTTQAAGYSAVAEIESSSDTESA